MPKNIEIKARVRDFNATKDSLERIAGSAVDHLRQVDTYFAVQSGRLKLRTINNQESQLIHYCREDESGPRPSDYKIVKVADGEELKKVLVSSVGIRGTVEKNRTLYKIGDTRVHLDIVEYLGAFLELEVPVTEQADEEDCRSEAKRIMTGLGIKEQDLLDGSYIDLLLLLLHPQYSGTGVRMIPYYDELIRLGLVKGQYAVFGSALLSLYRIRQARDLDIIVKKDVWYQLAKKYLNCVKQQPERIALGNIEIYKDWITLNECIDEMIDTADVIEDVPFVKMEYVVRWKRAMGRPKDLKDIRLIADFMNRR